MGWYEGLYELQQEDHEQIEEKLWRVNLDDWKEEWGITEFAAGRDGAEALQARAYEPTANIAGIIAG